MRKLFSRKVIIVVAVAACVLITLLAISLKSVLRINDILAAYDEKAKYGELTIGYPLNKTLFPPEIAPATFRWDDKDIRSDTWLITIKFQDNNNRLNFITDTPDWTPRDGQWETIKRRSSEKDAAVTIIGLNSAAPTKILSAASITIDTSKDAVGAPLFYREVNLPFNEAAKDPSLIRWRFGEISSKARPPVVLEGLPVCGNCHSFSADGSILGMDVDYGNDKGSYVITPITKETVLNKEKIITWSAYKKADHEETFGMLSQVSPDGRYVISTVKDRSVFVPKPELAFSQLFFPIKGILAVYDRETKTFQALPGADNKEFVQSNPSWSPDGKYIVFARNKAYRLKKDISSNKVLLSEKDAAEFLKEGKTFLFDLYRIPFNGGKGGEAKPLAGASGNGMSNYFARYSPDGKWIVFCKAGSFMLLQPDSQLYIMPAGGGGARKMQCNRALMNSWHSWSPNGKWLVFSSKANGPYTQLFLTHIDEQGNDTPPVLLERLTSPDRAANIPEFVNVRSGALKIIHEQFVDDTSFSRASNQFIFSGDYDSAAQAALKALSINPDNAYAHLKMGEALEQQNKLEEAVIQLAEAVKINPDDFVAHNELGVALAMRAMQAENLIRTKEQLGPVPDSVKIKAQNAAMYKEAVFHLKEAIRLNPNCADAYNNWGLTLKAQGEFKKAVPPLTEALRLNPDYAQAHNNLGWTLKALGNLDEAIIHFNKALMLNPSYPEAREGLNQALRQKRDQNPQQ